MSDSNVVFMYNKVFCDSCGNRFDSSMPFDSSAINNGSTLTITGGYSEFFDGLDDDIAMSLVMCHDCTLKIFNFFMASDKYAFVKHEYLGNAHYAGETHCCEYSFNAEENLALLEETAVVLGYKNENSFKGEEE